ncbi:NB-ARC domain-containing protein [Mastigocoleus sp. MO_188.B34]|uniref:WD40 domain-containing protein n=1 Tax=Mastigocoleus sp. MO_188.B34 TaxID=3036635 RepID=UPI00260B6A19|nr:NB-ARC domain-containing protein [Mastigocoleus sp. MO_188.B34]MDJ0695382.1 NB-ARC domain-containing protein [Mastigocoleus sp. MO_188.B34]
MERQKRRRKRGVILTDVGLQKLTNAKHQAECLENDGAKFTLEELSFRTQLAPFTISKVLAGEEAVDKQTLEYFFYAFNLHLTQDDYTKPGNIKHTKIEKKFLNQGLKSQISDLKPDHQYLRQKTDWGEAVDVSIFFGRFEELTQLEKWIVNSNCRLVALLGIGGVGKTSVSVKLAQQLEEKFEFVVWRSLRNSQTLEELLKSLLLFCAQGEDVNISENIGELISQFLSYLRSRRYLIILDNVESILASGDNSGYYQTGYENYGQFWQRIAETPHQSCLLLTSREKPREVAALEGETLPVRSLNLEGLGEDAALELLQTKGFSSDYKAEWEYLINHYGGNPLALKIVATTIRELFDGDVQEFCSQGTMVFGSIYDLLSQQFHRLSDLEKDLLYWLAINREPVTLKKLRADFVLPVSPMKMLEALEFLSRRSLIEKSKNSLHKTKSTGKSTGTSIKFTLQPVVMEYVTRRLIQKVTKEIEDKTHNLNVPAFAPSFAHKTFNTHTLIQATAKDYIRITQTKLILQPVIEQLLLKLHHKQGIKTTLTNILYELQQINFENIVSSPNPVLEPGYAAGNILNLLSHLQADLRGYNLSYLSIWQAYFQETPLQQVNFSHSDLSNSVFAKTFGVAMSAVFSPDGKTLVTGHSEGLIFLWNLATSELLTNYQAHKGPVWSLIYINDSTFVSTSHDGTIKFWETSTGQCIKTLQGHQGSVYNAVLTTDGKTLISSGADCTIRIWNIVTKECTKVLRGHTKGIWGIALIPNVFLEKEVLEEEFLEEDSTDQKFTDTGTTDTENLITINSSMDGAIASASDDGNVKLWDLVTGECIHTFIEHREWVKRVVINSQGVLASCSLDQTIRLWDIQSKSCIGVLDGYGHGVMSITFVGDKPNLLASCSVDGKVRLWDIMTKKCIKIFQGHKNSVDNIVSNAQGTLLLSCSQDFSIKLWDIANGECIRTLKARHSWVGSVAYFSKFNPSKFNPSKFNSSRLDSLKLDSSKPTKSDQTGEKQIGLIASGSEDSIVRLWNLQTLDAKSLRGHTEYIFAVEFSPDGKIVASGSADLTIRLWNVETGECIKVLRGHKSLVTGLAFSPVPANFIGLQPKSGYLLASSSYDRTVRLWDPLTGELLHTLPEYYAMSVDFSPDGKSIAVGSFDDTVRIWDLETKECRQSFKGDSILTWRVAFHPQGNILATANSADMTVRLWDITTGKCMNIFSGHTNWILGLTFSPDGNLLASCSSDRTIKLWDVVKGEYIVSIDACETWVMSVVFSSDGKTLISSDGDSAIKVWDVETFQCLQTLKIPRLYENMNLYKTTGLTEAQKTTLQELGSISVYS